MIAVDLASEGLDIPGTNIIALLRMTDSRAVFEQQIGRGVRKTAGKDVLTALDFCANGERLYMLHRFLEELRHEYRQYYRRRSAQEGVPPDAGQEEKETEEFVRSFGFKFSPQQLDVITRMRQIHEAPPAETGWQNTTRLAEEHNTTAHEINHIVKDLRLEGTIMHAKGANEADLFYSPQQQLYIGFAVAWNRHVADWESRTALAARTGRTRSRIERLVKEMGAQFRPVRIGSKTAIIPPEISKAVAEECAREGMNITQLGIQSGKNRYQVKKAIASLGITGKDIGGKSTGPIVIYPADDCKRILDKLAGLEVLEPTPKGYTPFPEAKASMPDTDVDALADKLGIVPGRYSNERNQGTRYLSPTELTKLQKGYAELDRGTPIAKVATRLGVSEVKARRLAADLLGSDKARLTEEEIITLSADPYVSAADAPSTHKLKYTIVRNNGITPQAFDRAVRELGIKPDKYKTTDLNRPLLLPHYSDEEQTAIVNHAKQGDRSEIIP